MIRTEADAVDAIVATYALLTRSNTLLMSRSMRSTERRQLQSIIVLSRKMYQKLAKSTFILIRANSSSQSQTRSLSPVLEASVSHHRHQKSVDSVAFNASNVSDESQANEFEQSISAKSDMKRKRAKNKAVKDVDE